MVAGVWLEAGWACRVLECLPPGHSDGSQAKGRQKGESAQPRDSLLSHLGASERWELRGVRVREREEHEQRMHGE